MRKLIKLKVIFLIFSIVFTSVSIAADLILPASKPVVDEETKTITAKKKGIYPQKKPGTESKSTEVIDEQKVEAIEELT